MGYIVQHSKQDIFTLAVAVECVYMYLNLKSEGYVWLQATPATPVQRGFFVVIAFVAVFTFTDAGCLLLFNLSAVVSRSHLLVHVLYLDNILHSVNIFSGLCTIVK